MKHASLFSGIGGFDLAAEWMGWENVFHCEINPFGRRVLSYYWPKAISYNDITQTDFSVHRGRIDIISGGFPCQPYSIAGKRKGKADDRHLWPAMLAAIKAIQPRWVVGENVHGIINWSRGMVFNEVQADLEAAGYEVFPYVLPACGVEAPHQRERVWFIAYCDRNGFGKFNGDEKNNQRGTEKRLEKRHEPCAIPGSLSSSDTDKPGSPLRVYKGFGSTQSQIIACEGGEYSRTYTKDNWREFPTQSPIWDGDDGLSDKLDGITFSEWRRESIKAGGNAIVPQVAYQIFKTIEDFEASNFSNGTIAHK